MVANGYVVTFKELFLVLFCSRQNCVMPTFCFVADKIVYMLTLNSAKDRHHAHTHRLKSWSSLSHRRSIKMRTIAIHVNSDYIHVYRLMYNILVIPHSFFYNV